MTFKLRACCKELYIDEEMEFSSNAIFSTLRTEYVEKKNKIRITWLEGINE